MSVDYRHMAAQAATRTGIPVPLFLGLVKQESGFNPSARSPSGALGLTQLMPSTARGLGVSNPFSPAENLAAGAQYLADQYKRFGRWDLALAAYNAGPGAVQKYGGIPPYAETQNYVRNILGQQANVGWGTPGDHPPPGGPPPTGLWGQGNPRKSFVSEMAQTIGLTGTARQQAQMAAILGLRRGLSEQTRQAQQSGAMQSVLMGGAPQGSNQGLNSDFLGRITALVDAVREAGGNLGVRSGFRTVAQQQALWDAALKKYGSAAAARRWVAPPGNSMHNKGLAADLAGNLDLAHKLAAKFGLAFPLSNEAWHVEPIGVR